MAAVKKGDYQVAKRRAAALSEMASRVSGRVLEVTTPIFRADEAGRPVPDGTGVLLQLGEIKFLVSAGHVLRPLLSEELRAGCRHQLVPIRGDITYVYGSPEPSVEGDPIDVRIVRLSGPDWDGLPIPAFLAWSELDLPRPVPDRHVHAMVGFTESQNRAGLNGMHFNAFAYQLLGIEAPRAVYDELHVNPQRALLLGFDKKRTWGPSGPETGPDLYGASGCGLWRFGPNLRDVGRTPRLSAIGVIWERQRKHKYVRGTRLDLIVAALAERYADVRAFVQRRH